MSVRMVDGPRLEDVPSIVADVRDYVQALSAQVAELKAIVERAVQTPVHLTSAQAAARYGYPNKDAFRAFARRHPDVAACAVGNGRWDVRQLDAVFAARGRR